jgi:hypothetical protein
VVFAGSAAAAAAWRDAPDFVTLFAPSSHRDAYRAAVSASSLDAIVRELAADAGSVPAPGAWTPRATSALDAFGRSGTYDRTALARLYGGRQPRVARGARQEDGRVSEAWLLVSPYPSADLSRLEAGTLRIVLRIAP